MIGADGALTDTERAVLGVDSTESAAAIFHEYCADVLGSPVERVLLRAGRIDVVWGVALRDGRRVAIKAHRPPTDVSILSTTRDAVEHLARAGYPAPSPVSGPDRRPGGHVLTAETLLLGGVRPDGSTAAGRRVLVEGLRDHIVLLQERTDLLDGVGPGPSWCRWADGPWPATHDPIVDLTTSEPGYEWLDDLARRAADRIAAHRGADRVLAHADWYSGNLAVAHDRLVATFDWDLIADAESVAAGFAAASVAEESAASGAPLSTAAGSYLRDYEDYRARPFSPDEWRAAAGALTWILAFNARWQTGLLEQGLGDVAPVVRLREERDDCLALRA